MSFGQRLRKKRIEMGLSQEELATRLKYSSRSSINKIELGTQDMPQSKIAECAKILNVSPNYFFEQEDTLPNFLAYGGSSNANTNTQHPTTDFTYAMYEEEKNLTEEDKDELKRMAKILSNKNKGIL